MGRPFEIFLIQKRINRHLNFDVVSYDIFFAGLIIYQINPAVYVIDGIDYAHDPMLF